MNKRFPLEFFIIVLVSLLTNIGLVFSQEVSVTNVFYSIKDSDVVVHYSLNGPAGEPYKVQLVLRRESEPSFIMLPISITGDIGTGKFAGKNREIIWHLGRDDPYGLQGNDYYFVVNATPLVVKKGGVSWLYYAGGAVVIGAAAVYFGPGLFKGTPGNNLPAPPGRP